MVDLGTVDLGVADLGAAELADLGPELGVADLGADLGVADLGVELVAVEFVGVALAGAGVAALPQGRLSGVFLSGWLGVRSLDSLDGMADGRSTKGAWWAMPPSRTRAKHFQHMRVQHAKMFKASGEASVNEATHHRGDNRTTRKKAKALDSRQFLRLPS